MAHDYFINVALAIVKMFSVLAGLLKKTQSVCIHALEPQTSQSHPLVFIYVHEVYLLRSVVRCENTSGNLYDTVTLTGLTGVNMIFHQDKQASADRECKTLSNKQQGHAHHHSE